MGTVFWALVVLSVLIFVHELGHFLVARWAGVRVLTFSLGFGPRILSWQGGAGGTEYQVSAIPLGGYVKMLGEATDDDEEEVPEDQRHFMFSEKSVWSRIAIVFAGPLFNFLFAMVALSFIFMIGVNELLPVVGEVSPNMPAAEAGMKSGDRVVRINDTPIDRWHHLSRMVRNSEGETLDFEIERDGTLLQIPITPKISETSNAYGESVKTLLVGIKVGNETTTVHYGFSESLIKGVEKTWDLTVMMVTGIWKLITAVVGLDQVGGPLLIAEMAGKTASQGASSFLYFMALISINLGILNLLPVPVLDGGHLMFYCIEAIKGNPVSENMQMIANRIGMTLLAGLMILAFFNDIVRLFS
ncbi:MAG: RIP metalloprotease RseP [Magnetococcales bacterium]|nr:RIP metalloprotease RseP [Magnetococcales bacterium]